MVSRGPASSEESFSLERLIRGGEYGVPEPEQGVLVEYGPRETKKATWHSPKYAPGRWPKDENRDPLPFANLSLYAQAYLLQSYANELNDHLSSENRSKNKDY